MGLKDAQEMLDAALADALVYERTIAALKAKLAAVRDLAASDAITLQDSEDAGYEVVEVWKLQQILDADE